VAFGTEGEHGVGGQPDGAQVVAGRVEADDRIRQVGDPAHRHGVVQPARGPHDRRVPGVDRAGGEHLAGPEAGRHPHDRAEVAEVARVVQEDRRAAPGRHG